MDEIIHFAAAVLSRTIMKVRAGRFFMVNLLTTRYDILMINTFVFVISLTSQQP